MLAQPTIMRVVNHRMAQVEPVPQGDIGAMAKLDVDRLVELAAFLYSGYYSIYSRGMFLAPKTLSEIADVLVASGVEPAEATVNARLESVKLKEAVASIQKILDVSLDNIMKSVAGAVSMKDQTVTVEYPTTAGKRMSISPGGVASQRVISLGSAGDQIDNFRFVRDHQDLLKLFPVSTGIPTGAVYAKTTGDVLALMAASVNDLMKLLEFFRKDFPGQTDAAALKDDMTRLRGDVAHYEDTIRQLDEEITALRVQPVAERKADWQARINEAGAQKADVEKVAALPTAKLKAAEQALADVEELAALKADIDGTTWGIPSLLFYTGAGILGAAAVGGGLYAAGVFKARKGAAPAPAIKVETA